ncbi:pentapeptide repeat-containing protein [Archangium lansingense]|uniref:pentapeptide repeat-containing protein n=1 Tax=Archangium lansingense TaxID=2995310 RepID=UPI003B8029A6
MWPGNIFFENREIEDERVELAGAENQIVYFGPNLTLRRCTVVVRVPGSRLIVRQLRLIDCTIEFKQELRNHRGWVSAALKGCRIKGRLTGCDFGPFPEYSTGGEHGLVEDCDFSEARLDGCRFHGCDMRTIRLPRWPCFTILDPIGNAAALSRLNWPGRFGRVIINTLVKDPPSTVAETWHAPSVTKGLDTTPDELRSVLEGLECIVM